MATTLFAAPPCHRRPLSRRHCFSGGAPRLDSWGPSSRVRRAPSKLNFSASSSTPTSSSVVEDGLPPPPPPPPPPSDPAPLRPASAVEGGDVAPPRGCKACGREELERGCNGEGRIQGGIATVPGFGWWPIKAYRPCPGFVASGGRYRRQGQSMDEVAFGRGGSASGDESDSSS
ncbi:actin cytoskeleton-regulatory complex protein pan1 isoform X2 [Eucalyptus grandis]|uniref:actin cytoskeleton-regulatory complex protein pan1 isoform X2 n=1 Tax=Eucalyptus grandis TaxID=71139 RepID=UPI00192E92CE|nr:actin cytoskeleton-regulatory complex protein pan1 isoform X2 [Eucalyptus grandis]